MQPPEAFICKKAFICRQHHQVWVIMFLHILQKPSQIKNDKYPPQYKVITVSADTESVHVYVKASTTVSCMHLQPLYVMYGRFKADTTSILDARCCFARPYADHF